MLRMQLVLHGLLRRTVTISQGADLYVAPCSIILKTHLTALSLVKDLRLWPIVASLLNVYRMNMGQRCVIC